ncbi:MAG TPA: sulfotransferase [Acidimicrobiales bacterium]|nr:sulfotransferase [Acidimicrobiales bacterium]
MLRRVRAGALSLDPDELVATARARTRLDDLDLPSYRRPPSSTTASFPEPLAVLTRSLEQEADLTPAGRYFAREQIISSLSNRLALAEVLAREPGIASSELAPAIVIVGLPRSGTTLLQHLMARDPAHRVLHHWEAARPAAPRGPAADLAAQRATARSLRLLDYLAPDARVLHPVDALEPTECVTLFSNSFASLELATMHQVPSYLRWCLDHDLADAYREYGVQLRVLQSRERRPRWLLKCPAHLFWVDQLLEVLPDATVVQIHRDPLEVLGSFCSLSAVLCGIGSDRVDLQAIGERWAPAWAEGLARMDRTRAQWPQARFVDVDYRRLLADPLATVAGVYDRCGLALTDLARVRMGQFLATHVQHAGGVHRYSLEQFGLDADQERARFATFRA